MHWLENVSSCHADNKQCNRGGAVAKCNALVLIRPIIDINELPMNNIRHIKESAGLSLCLSACQWSFVKQEQWESLAKSPRVVVRFLAS